MSEAVIAVKALKSKYWNEEKQKFVTSKQFKDESGNAVGPVQYFEADTLEELLEKKDAAHENASVALYKTRKAVKLGTLLEPDPDEPILTFEPRQLTADERVRLTKDLSDPAKAAEAHRALLEAELGAPIETIRTSLRDAEIQKRVVSIQDAIAQFKKSTPEYVESESNGQTLNKYMEKKQLRYTAHCPSPESCSYRSSHNSGCDARTRYARGDPSSGDNDTGDPGQVYGSAPQAIV